MPTPTTCPHCQGEIAVADDLRPGDAVACPLCRKEFSPSAPPDARRKRWDDDRDDDDSDDGRYSVSPRRRAVQKVSGPSSALRVVGYLNIIMGVIHLMFSAGLLAFLAAGGFPGAPGGPAGGGGGAAAGGMPPNAALMQQGVVGFLQTAAAIGLGWVMVYGAGQMAAFKSYGWSMAAAIVALFPCNALSCCLLGAVVYVVGLIFGILALIALSDAGVKRQFGTDRDTDEGA